MEVSYVQGTVLSQPRLGIGQNFTSKKENLNRVIPGYYDFDYIENMVIVMR